MPDEPKTQLTPQEIADVIACMLAVRRWRPKWSPAMLLDWVVALLVLGPIPYDTTADLPPGALVRLGSHAFRPGTDLGWVGFAADGRSLVAVDVARRAMRWGVPSGRTLP